MNQPSAPSILQDSAVSSLSSGLLNMNNNKIVNLAEPTADSDAATKLYVDENAGQLTQTTHLEITNPTGTTLIVDSSTDVDIFGFSSAVSVNGGVYIDKNLFLNNGLIINRDNGKVGTVQLVNGSATVMSTAINSNSYVFLTIQSPVNPGTVYVSNKVHQTSFDVTSTSGTDGSTVAYLIIDRGQDICFHKDTLVTLENDIIVKLKDLKHNSKVLCRLDNGTYVFSKVLTFTGYFPDKSGRSLKITYGAYGPSGPDEESITSISISYNHLLFAKKLRTKNDHILNKFDYVPAYDLVPGDLLMTYNNIYTKILKIEPEENLVGWYTPLTECGTIIVNDIIASCHTDSSNSDSYSYSNSIFSLSSSHKAIDVFYYPLKSWYKLWPHKEGSTVTEGSHFYSVYFRRSVVGRVIVSIINFFL